LVGKFLLLSTEAQVFVHLTYPHGKQVHYGYDTANQLITVIDWADRETGYEWDGNGRLVKEMRPNKTPLTRRYDKAGQLVQQQDVSPSGSVIAQFDFTYDAVGNITNETPALKPPVFNATMTYTTANRLATYNGEAVEFDADGNMTTGPLFDGMTAFRFDSRNRLIGVADTVYRYDAENQRVAMSVAGATSSYVINPQAALSQVLVRTAPSGTTYYVYGLGLIGEETNNNYQAYHYDLRGSTVTLSDSAGAVVERFAYSAFAQLVSHPDGLPATPFLYNGRDGVMTDASGLYYMRARYYSSEIRRFVNQDVLLGNVGDGQSLNRYAFVTGNPVSFVDPFGLYYRYALYAQNAKYVLPNAQGARTISQYYQNPAEFNRNQNCYSFAVGYFQKRPNGATPGYAGGDRPQSFTCVEFIKGARKDGLIASSDINYSPNQRQAALVVSTKKVIGLGGVKEKGDHHWYTPYNDYFWMHKRGNLSPSLFDSKGYLITNPKTANRSYPDQNPDYNANYNEFCDYFSVPPNTQVK
jgi:RHS repeat-associated protein